MGIGDSTSTVGSAIMTAGAAPTPASPWLIGIGAGTALIGGLLSSAARREEEKRKRQFEGEMMGLQTQANAEKSHQESQIDAFHQMMQAYNQSLNR